MSPQVCFVALQRTPQGVSLVRSPRGFFAEGEALTVRYEISLRASVDPFNAKNPIQSLRA
ncbi:MAG: hypothetical protein VZR09_10810 [Candidatus Gastranaerophilaceae bacterium]|nr:hypothetical protein [Candidatus Gastranaerophilaceae bacterium]